MHLKKIHLKNRQIVQIPIPYTTLKVFENSRASVQIDFFVPFTNSVWQKYDYFSVTTLIWLFVDVKQPKKAWTDLNTAHQYNSNTLNFTKPRCPQ